MSDPKLSEQIKIKAVKSLPVLVAQLVSLSYRGIVVLLHFIKQLLFDALGK